jgi:general secretion pathway protein L
VVTSSEEGVLHLPLTPSCAALLPALPEEAPRQAEPAVAAVAEQVLQQKFTLQQAPQRWVDAARTRWDLGQFEFASSPRARRFKKVATGWGELLRSASWRPARWAVVALVLVHVGGLNAWAWKERASLSAKRDAVRRTLTDTFPQVKVVVDAPVQMEREVAALRQQTGVASARDLDAVLGALAAALPPGRVPASLQYSGSELRAGALALSPGELEPVTQQLRALGYTVRAEGSTLVVAAEDAR